MARVHHAHLWGTRDSKGRWLDAHDVTDTPWQDLHPKAAFYFLVPRDEALESAYRRLQAIPEIFPVNSVGIVTARDALTIRWSPEEVWRTVTVFARMDPELARKGYKLGRDARDWKVALAQKDLIDSGPDRQNVVSILYRPFDRRHTYYTGTSRGFLCMPRPEVMRNVLQENVALCVGRAGQVVGTESWNLCFCTTFVTDFNLFYRGGNLVLPLHIYPNSERDLFAAMGPAERSPNLDPKLLKALKAAHCRYPTPEQVFHYVYAVLYAPTYREKYAEFLRTDFPRVPFTGDAGLFAKVAKLGERLTELHLLRSTELDTPAARFEGQGDGKVAKGTKAGLRYDPNDQRVYINKTQHFAPVPQDVWDYRVGGYQVCEKWLKDRRERRLSMEEIKTYCRIVTALGLTIDIQQALESLYPAIEESLLPIELGSRT